MGRAMPLWPLVHDEKAPYAAAVASPHALVAAAMVSWERAAALASLGCRAAPGAAAGLACCSGTPLALPSPPYRVQLEAQACSVADQTP